jgi:Fe2+ transport system protein FeoA
MVQSTPRPFHLDLPPGAPADSRPADHLPTLDGLKPSQGAVVHGLEGAPVLRRRLLEAGFVAGSPVHFLMATPFGDPLVFSMRGTSIALRKSEARCVRVRPF